MSQALLLIRIALRVSILILLVLGVLFWTGRALQLVPLHMSFGLVFVLGLWSLAALGLNRGLSAGANAAIFVLGLAVLGLGMMQTRLLPGEMHWVVRAIHLLLGLGAMGFAESVAKRLATGIRTPAA